MSVRRDDTASKPDELQMGSSWIPATPAKATSLSWPPNWGENQTVQANWLEKERLAPTNQVAQGDYVQQTQFQREPACYDSMGASRAANNWHAAIPANSAAYEENLVGFDSWLGRDGTDMYGKGSSTYDKLSLNDQDQLSNVSFGHLMIAMSKKAEMENAHAHNNFATSSSSSSCFHQRSLLEERLARSGVSTPYFHPPVEGSQFTMSSRTASLQDQHTILGSNFDAEMRIPNTITGKFTICDYYRQNHVQMFSLVITKNDIDLYSIIY